MRVPDPLTTLLTTFYQKSVLMTQKRDPDQVPLSVYAGGHIILTIRICSRFVSSTVCAYRSIVIVMELWPNTS